MKTLETLKARIRKQSTAEIVACVRTIGGGHVDVDRRTVRAALLDVYEEREGGEAVDRFMDEIGLGL